MLRILQGMWGVVLCAALVGCSSKSGAAPDVFKVNLDTSKGSVVIEVHREWAPIGADHFLGLVKAGYFDGDRFFRVVPGFVVQFGLAADPATTAKWNSPPLMDDPVTQSNTGGRVPY